MLSHFLRGLVENYNVDDQLGFRQSYADLNVCGEASKNLLMGMLGFLPWTK